MSSLKNKFDDYREEPQHATWQQLLKKLNAEMPVRRKRRYLLWLPVLLVSTATAWWLYANTSGTRTGTAYAPDKIESVSNTVTVKSTAPTSTAMATPSDTRQVIRTNNYTANPAEGSIIPSGIEPELLYLNPATNPNEYFTVRTHQFVNILPSRKGPFPLKGFPFESKIDNTLLAVRIPIAEPDSTVDSSPLPPLRPKNNENKFVLGFDYAAGLSNIILRDPTTNIIPTKTTTSNKTLRKGISKAGFSQSFGFTLKMEVQKNIRLKTGFYFTFVNQSLYYNTQKATCNCGDPISLQQVDGSIKESDMTNTTDSISIGNNNSFTNKYSLREIPLILEYILPMDKNSRFSYTLSLGTSFMYMRGINIKIPDADNVGFVTAINKNTTANIFPSYQNTFNGIMGFGFNYKVKRNVEYSIAPEFKMALTSLSKNNLWFREYPWQFHLSFGIGKSF